MSCNQIERRTRYISKEFTSYALGRPEAAARTNLQCRQSGPDDIQALLLLQSNSLEISTALLHDNCDAKIFVSCLMTIDAGRFSNEHVSSRPAAMPRFRL
ncbi:hypothetical protein AM571_CH03004 [Rhizobium etli 8C-3]|uniref:Uncharacterized protein n=1 Tax=Rhizobium etli 8C-3 TaxID=538025 RepID=A0A1L5P6T1_RHIET|nr:hypothetical protein AM571_CH03004 [Rhizobium etli 8C-3]